MPQKGLKKDDGVRGRREKITSKVFSFFPGQKSTFPGNRAYYFTFPLSTSATRFQPSFGRRNSSTAPLLL